MPSCTTIYESFDFLLYEYQQNLSNLEENDGKVSSVYKENHVCWLLIDLESYNWYQMITRVMFYNHVI